MSSNSLSAQIYSHRHCHAHPIFAAFHASANLVGAPGDIPGCTSRVRNGWDECSAATGRGQGLQKKGSRGLLAVLKYSHEGWKRWWVW
jgi:hypothetical protein